MTKEETGEASTVHLSIKAGRRVFPTQLMLFFIVVIIVIVFSIFAPYFFTVHNAMNIALQATIVGLLALGQTFVLISGGIDLSSVANLALSGVIGASVMKAYGIFPAIIVMLVISTAVGVLNAVSVVKMRMVPFMVTLAVMTMCTGLALLYTKAVTIGGLPETFKALTTTKLWIFPVPVIIVTIIYIIAHIYLSRGTFGRRLFSVGLGIRAARLAGIPTSKVVMSVYILSGFLAGVASILLVSKLGSAGAGMVREDLILDNISSAVMGGASIYGGRGSAWGTIIGVFFIVIIGNALNLLGVTSFTILIVKGLIILFAIFADTMRVRFLER